MKAIPYWRYIQDMYPTNILTNEKKFEMLLGGRGCGRMAMYNGGYTRMEECCEDRNIRLLYKTTWGDKEVSKLDSSHIINILLKLDREVLENKTAFEIFLVDLKEDEFVKPKYDLMEIAKMSPKEWLESLPIWKELMKELDARNLKAYYEIVKARKEIENEK